MNNRKGMTILAYLISLMPLNGLRVLLYRILFGYRIHRSSIGWKTMIVVDKAELTECLIGRGNRFVGPMSITIKKGASIGKRNTFSCGWWTKDEEAKSANYDRSLRIGANTMITSEHHFDAVGAFSLGDNSWIAGYGSQFWTHGAGVRERNVSIGEGCYLGSAVRFAPGSSVGDNVIVALGSVVTKQFTTANCVVAGQPAKITKENYDWKNQEDIS